MPVANQSTTILGENRKKWRLKSPIILASVTSVARPSRAPRSQSNSKFIEYRIKSEPTTFHNLLLTLPSRTAHHVFMFKLNKSKLYIFYQSSFDKA